MKKLFLSPIFSFIFIVIALGIYFGVSYFFRWRYGVFDIEEIGVTEILTNVFYGFAGGVVVCLAADHLGTKRHTTYIVLLFLWTIALLREMGIQHWLAVNDTTAIKINYFKNAAVPMYSKIIAATFILLVCGAILYLIIKHIKTMIVQFFKFNPVYWTIAAFGGLGFLTQIADRFPAKYGKITGIRLEEPARFALKIFEEGGESLLPLLFAIAFAQYHFILRKKISQTGDAPTNTDLD